MSQRDTKTMGGVLGDMLGGSGGRNEVAPTPVEPAREMVKTTARAKRPAQAAPRATPAAAASTKAALKPVTTRLPADVVLNMDRALVELRADFAGLEKQELLAAVLAKYVQPTNLVGLRDIVTVWRANEHG